MSLARQPETGAEARVSKKHEKLISLLKELFQLDQPDLDFGLYRIMHVRVACQFRLHER